MANETKSTPKSVLVIDDDQDIVVVLEEFLKESGYDVAVAYDGIDALSHIHSRLYDAVICDMMMPRMSGEELYNEVERSEPGMTRRFVFITGMSRVSDVQRFFHQKDLRHLDKPFHPEDVLQMVKEIIQENK